MRDSAVGPEEATGVDQRVVPTEPMYLILNLGISPNFGAIDWDGLEEMWPVHMLIDYVRVYQHPDRKNIGCDPVDRPTSKYIQDHLVAYT
jgi:beta-glucanase (GH16 family)